MEEIKNTEQTNKPRPSDEIDLIELFSRMGRGIKNFFYAIFKYLFDFLFYTVKFFYKNAIPIGGFTFAGFVAGTIIYYVSDKEYSSEMVASSNSLRNDEMINYINKLDELCKTENYTGLGKYLDMDSLNASKIKYIKALWAFDRNRDNLPDYVDYSGRYDIRANDTIQRRLWDRFYVRAVVTDDDIFNRMKDGLYKYIYSNQYVQETNNIRKKQQAEMIKEIDNEIKKLDSLQKYEYFNQNRIMPQVGANQMVLFTEKDRRLYHKDIFTLVEQRQDLETKLTVRKDPITIIQDFTPMNKVENTIFTYLLKFSIIGFLLGSLIIFIWLYGRKIHKTLLEE